MTRILLLGASGRTGLLTLSEAQTRSHTITALVRQPSSIPASVAAQAGVTVITGTPERKADIAKAFDSAPASDPIRVIVSALNNGRTSDLPWAKTTAPKSFLADCARNCISVLREGGVSSSSCKKIVWLGTNGVGESRKSVPWFFKLIVDNSNLKITFDDHFETQKVLEAEAEKDTAFKWVDIRASGLSGGPKKVVKHYGNDGHRFPMLGMISRDSVAGFMVDCVESDKWDGQTPVISN